MSLVERVHNPKQRLCGCPPECVCQRSAIDGDGAPEERSAIGRALRWYIPGRFHTPVPHERKQWLETQGMSFRDE